MFRDSLLNPEPRVQVRLICIESETLGRENVGHRAILTAEVLHILHGMDECVYIRMNEAPFLHMDQSIPTTTRTLFPELGQKKYVSTIEAAFIIEHGENREDRRRVRSVYILQNVFSTPLSLNFVANPLPRTSVSYLNQSSCPTTSRCAHQTRREPRIHLIETASRLIGLNIEVFYQVGDVIVVVLGGAARGWPLLLNSLVGFRKLP